MSNGLPARHLAELMTERGFTRRQLVRVLREHGVVGARQCVHAYLTGTRNPSPNVAAVLCVAFDLDARGCLELFEACGIPTPDPVWAAVHGVEP